MIGGQGAVGIAMQGSRTPGLPCVDKPQASPSFTATKGVTGTCDTPLAVKRRSRQGETSRVTPYCCIALTCCTGSTQPKARASGGALVGRRREKKAVERDASVAQFQGRRTRPLPSGPCQPFRHAGHEAPLRQATRHDILTPPVSTPTHPPAAANLADSSSSHPPSPEP